MGLFQSSRPSRPSAEASGARERGEGNRHPGERPRAGFRAGAGRLGRFSSALICSHNRLTARVEETASPKTWGGGATALGDRRNHIAEIGRLVPAMQAWEHLEEEIANSSAQVARSPRAIASALVSFLQRAGRNGREILLRSMDSRYRACAAPPFRARGNIAGRAALRAPLRFFIATIHGRSPRISMNRGPLRLTLAPERNDRSKGEPHGRDSNCGIFGSVALLALAAASPASADMVRIYQTNSGGDDVNVIDPDQQDRRLSQGHQSRPWRDRLPDGSASTSATSPRAPLSTTKTYADQKVPALGPSQQSRGGQGRPHRGGDRPRSWRA
jgi:hypothetical protein